MSFTISEVQNNKDLNKFVDLPWKIYQKDTTWVPPLKMAVKDMFKSKHPFYETAKTKTFVAKESGEVIGRIVAVVNEAHNKFHEEKCGFFGFFEVIPQRPDVARELLHKAETWVKEMGMDTIRGPISPSTNYECGLLVEGFEDSPQLMMTYNPPEYRQLIEDCGYHKGMDLLAYSIDLSFIMPEKIVRVARKAEERDSITYRPINMKKWDQEIRLMLEVYNSAWEKNWGFVPMTEKEFLHTANDLKSVVNEDLIMFTEVAGEMAGFIVALPDYNQIFKKIPNGKLLPTGIFKLLTGKKHITRCRVITMGVKEKFRNLGLGGLMYQKMHENLKRLGFKEAEMSWILETNVQMNKPLQVMGATPYKRYRIFEKNLATLQ